MSDVKGKYLFPNLDIDEVMELASRVGRKVANEYPGLDADDITSEALTRLAEKAESLKTDDAGYIYKVLENDAIRYAAKVRYDYMMAHANFVYTTREVRALLQEAYFDPTAWDVPSAKDDYLTATVSKATLGVSLMDLRGAWTKLKPAYKDALIRKFREDEEGVPPMQVTRAVAALTRYVNGRSNRNWVEHEGPGARKLFPNADAQHRVSEEPEASGYANDAVDEYQAIRSRQSAPAGTYYNWGNE